MPDGFADESVSVIIVTTTGDDDEWRKKYRRLFSALNRNAKPVDADTIIAMDEDDLFCILTRRVIMEHPFFFWDGAAEANIKVQCKGANITSYKTGITKGEPKGHFTTLQTLKEMNLELLRTTINENKWKIDPFSNNKIKLSQFIQNRPSEDDIEKYYEELSDVWDAILEALPDLKEKDPMLMRVNNCDEEELAHRPGSENNALFRPLIQEKILAPLARTMLNDDEAETKEEMVDSLKKLSKLNWSLHEAPWRHLILIQGESGWKMANEDRDKRIVRLEQILHEIFGITSKSDEELLELKGFYQSYLSCSDEEKESLWEEILKMKKEISS